MNDVDKCVCLVVRHPILGGEALSINILSITKLSNNKFLVASTKIVVDTVEYGCFDKKDVMVGNYMNILSNNLCLYSIIPMEN